ncbi:putative uncharacterized protein [Phascolarctobacterium succinatutens CAG:287]|uniref:Uncharacterized protein n=1 Tax=Phascolarctobacterium succinatutens CAG:287 TaxID=1263101 RepID=R6XV24_9FIRM|nr:hypothetical protein [Phascolarctobacterium succinatutens]CDD10112.1 putative uncharacterized protein [Phascolarctobacterium succinatutens CAG:287]
MGGLFDHNLIPLLFVLVMLANVFLDRRNRRRRRQQELPQETAEPTQAEKQTQAKPKDLAAEFERRLKKTTEEAQARKRQSSQGVVHDGTRVRRDDGSRVHRDGEALHDHTGRIHRENEDLVHDRGKVYYDPRGDYSYDEAKMNAAAAAFNARYAQAQPAAKKRVKLKHAALVNGIIMAEVLGKPRALNPYEER